MLPFLLLSLSLSPSVPAAPPGMTDVLGFGSAVSETSHAFESTGSQTVTGGLGSRPAACCRASPKTGRAGRRLLR